MLRLIRGNRQTRGWEFIISSSYYTRADQPDVEPAAIWSLKAVPKNDRKYDRRVALIFSDATGIPDSTLN